MQAPLLSICIATYNRASYIGATLESILPQLDESTELVIVDGASSDDTAAIVADFVRRSDRIRYYRMETNGGVDKDFDTAVELASGDYCWLFADDDEFRPGAIARVQSHLSEGHSLLIVNTEVRNADMSRILVPNRLGFFTDRVYAIGEDDRLFAETSFYLSFIGAVVIDRRLWQARAKERYFGTEFIHFGVIFQAPLPSTTRVISEPQTKIRYGNALWTARGFEIWIMRWPSLVWSMPRSEEAKQQVVPRQRWRDPLMLLGHRAMGTYSIEQYEQWIAPANPSFFSRLLGQTIARIPGRALNAAVRAALSLLPGAKPMFALDLRNSRFAGRQGR
jgi:abequosyltransferase